MSGFNANDLAKERCLLASRRYEQVYIHIIVSDQICFNDITAKYMFRVSTSDFVVNCSGYLS